MKQENNLRNNLKNNLKSIRTRLGMSQQDLASLAGVTRQTISGIESEQYAPSVAISLRLAKSLGCQVEDLFWIEQDLPEITAVLAKPVPENQHLRVSLARVGGQWIAYPLIGKDAFRQDMIPADGEGIKQINNKLQVRVLDDNMTALHNTVVIAGCSPVISLWAKATERWHPQLRVQYNFANSMSALDSLSKGEAHIAGMHMYDAKTGEYNTPFVREVLIGREAVLITLGVWEEGLMVQFGNPKGIKSLTDLVEARATIVNREVGSGSRLLLEQTLEKAGISCDRLQGFDRIATSHQDVAYAVACGLADGGISTASVATAFGLGFIPFRQSRYDLVILKAYLEEAPVQQLLGTLGHRLVHSQLEILGGYDISKIGEVVANI